VGRFSLCCFTCLRPSIMITFSLNDAGVGATNWICARVRIVLLTLLFILPSLSFAVTMPATPWYNTEGTAIYTPGGTVKYFTTKQASCDYYFTRQYGSGLYRLNSATVGANNLCYLSFTNLSNGQTSYNSNNVMTAYACLSGWTLTGSTCTNTTCPAGMTANASGVCVDNCLPLKDQSGSFSINNSSIDVPSAVCMPNNCAATLSNSAVARDKATGLYNGYGEAKYTGLTCSGQTPSASLSNPASTQPPPADTPEAACLKNGQSYGTVNGVAVCVPKSSASATPVKDSSATTTTTTNTDANGNQSTSGNTEVKNVTQDGNQVTSTSTKTNADGSKSESTVTQPYDDFCAANPTNKICKKATDEDTADACEDNPDLPQCFNRGEPTDTDTISTVNKNFSFAPMAMASSAGCPADRVFVLSGRSFTVPFDRFCSLVASLKPLIIAFAYMTAAGIMFNGWKNS